jgi:hypothetical protein
MWSVLFEDAACQDNGGFLFVESAYLLGVHLRDAVDLSISHPTRQYKESCDD